MRLRLRLCPRCQPVVALPSDTATVEATTRFLENRVKQDPEDFIAYNKLATRYLQRLRETGDLTYVTLASRAAEASLAILPPYKIKKVSQHSRK